MQNKNGDQAAPESWEKLLETSGVNNLPQASKPGDTQAQPAKARKPLGLRAKGAGEFKPGEQSKDALGDFFKEEIAAYLKSASGKMFQSSVTINFKKPTAPTKATTTEKKEGVKPSESKSEVKTNKEIQEERKEKVEKAQKDKERKRAIKREEQAAKKKEAKKTVVDVEGVIKDKSKWDVEVDETRDPLNIVFIGHVDSGKSTICGGLLFWTGKIDQNEIRKLEVEAKEKQRDSWYLAYLMDINEEEKAKGKTVEVGRATFNLEKKRFTLLDAPGHKNYVPNMIQGAAQADVACLVISAKAGEFESGFDKGGQTREHAMLARALGVTELIILVNKMDEGSVNWSKDRFQEIKDKLGPFLQRSCGYDVNNSVKWVPISGLFGLNVKEKIEASTCKWYEGQPLLTIFNELSIQKRDPEGPIRVPVLDKYKEQGNLFVFGKVESGTIHAGQNITFLPYCDEGQIVALYNNDDQKIAYAKPGENVKIHIKGVEEDNVTKGDIICSNESWTQVCEQFEAKINILELPEHKPIMSNGYTCVIHIHTALEEIEVTSIVAEFDKATKENKKARFLKSGSAGVVKFETKNPICCEKYENMPSLGRFTLRDEGKTIAMGKISRIKPFYKD